MLFWESAKVSHRRVFALLTPEIHSYEMAQMVQKPVFALPGCQQMSVNTLLCDTLALADVLPRMFLKQLRTLWVLRVADFGWHIFFQFCLENKVFKSSPNLATLFSASNEICRELALSADSHRNKLLANQEGCAHVLRPCWPPPGVSRPSGPKTMKKSPNSLPGPSGPESQKSPEKVDPLERS